MIPYEFTIAAAVRAAINTHADGYEHDEPRPNYGKLKACKRPRQGNYVPATRRKTTPVTSDRGEHYPSIYAACQAIGCNPGDIHNSIKHGWRSKGRVWKFDNVKEMR